MILSFLALWLLEAEVNRQETSFYIITLVQVLMSNILCAFGKQRRSRLPQNFVSPSVLPCGCHLYLPPTVLPSKWAEWHFSGFLQKSKVPKQILEPKKKKKTNETPPSKKQNQEKWKDSWKTNEMSRKSEVDSTFPIYAHKNDSLIHFFPKEARVYCAVSP